MRIGIVTIAESMNYGQRLQNYAVEQALISLGHKPETIIKSFNVSCSSKQRMILKLNILLKRGRYNSGRRALSFDRFIRKRLHFSKDIFPNGNFTDYDFVVCGSDQIWNLADHLREEHKEFYFAQFIAPEKRVAFSASLGTNQLSAEQLAYVAEKADEMKAVSVREESGAQLLRPLCKNKIEVTIDPVFLLPAAHWRSIARRPAFLAPNEKYILTYFLSEPLPQTQSFIQRVAETLGLRLITLYNITLKKDFNDLYFGVGPEEFLYLTANSSLTITDSFHACAFSCIFHRPFRWFPKVGLESTSTRMENLFSLFSISDWAIGSSEESADHCLSCNHESIDPIIEQQRQHALDYLRNALKKGDE